METKKEFQVIGKNVIKKDALDKVTGKAVFAGNLKKEGMLYGAVLRSTIPSGILTKIDTSKAKEMDGVVCVLTAADIPGRNQVGIILKDEPVLVADKIRRIGDALALVAAKSEKIAQEALKKIEVTCSRIEPVLTIKRALEADSPKVHGDTNILQHKHLIHGDIEEGFAKSDVIVEHTYHTPMLSHMFIEPEAGMAEYKDGVLTVYSSTQNPHFDRGEIAAMMNFPQSKVRSVQMTTGGGFGGKLDISVQCHCALLAYYTACPVKLVRSRTESSLVSSKRHPMTIWAKTGATKEGKLMAMDVYMQADTGAYASYGPAVITRAMVHCTGPYTIPHVRAEAVFVYTNNPMAGAFRGFGVPQAALVHEGQIQALAKELQRDPIELRLKNAQQPGCMIATGQILGSDVGLTACIAGVLDQELQLKRAQEQADQSNKKDADGREGACS